MIIKSTLINLGKQHNYYETENLRSSFSMLKNSCLSNNNVIDGNIFHYLELLFYKAELSKRSMFENTSFMKSKKQKSSIIQKLKNITIFPFELFTKKTNWRLFVDRILINLNEFISNHYQNTFRAICIWLVFGVISTVFILYNPFTNFIINIETGKAYPKYFSNTFLEITFPLYSAPDSIFIGIFKIISIYIIWQIIKSARNSFR